MNLLRLLFSPVSRQAPPKVEPDMRKITASLAMGNINLQKGQYVTREDIDTLAAKVWNYKFN